MRTKLEFGLIAVLIGSFLIIPKDLSLDILDSRIYFGTAPMFFFSLAIYSAQGLITLYLFKGFGLSRSIGYTSILLVSAYSSYELAFKLSFLLFGPSNLTYFTNYEIYPSLVFIVSIATVIGISDKLCLRPKFWIASSLLIGAWILWLASGNFPIYIQAYETNPSYGGVFFNYSTKLLTSSVYIFAAKR